LLNEVIENLNIKSSGVYVDGTVGGGSHSYEIAKRIEPGGILIGIDQDICAINASRIRLKEYAKNIILINDNFKNIKNILQDNEIDKADGILLDLGVSSHQLDEAKRGFSYMKDAPLDMRMDTDNILTAEIIVNDWVEEEIYKIIRDYGEEKWAKRITSFICRERLKKRIETTYELVEIIKAAIPASARRRGPHPAKRTFQAIRIAVNNELGILNQAIKTGVEALKPGGRFCIITFHSLEDRIVKTAFNKLENPCICPPEAPICICGKISYLKVITRKPITASIEEIEKNPRSRSAKLRVAEKIGF